MMLVERVTENQGRLHFWLAWVLASGIGSAVGLACGLICAYILSAFLMVILDRLPQWLHPLMALVPVVGAGFGGLMIGAVVGQAQADRLAWPDEVRARWRRQSAMSWAVGSALGFPLSVVTTMGLWAATGSFDLPGVLPLTELTAAFIGLALGIGLRPVVPAPAPPLAPWALGHMAATSLGWGIARPFDGGVFNLGLAWTGAVLGPLVYAMITGAMMLWVERRRAVVATDA